MSGYRKVLLIEIGALAVMAGVLIFMISSPKETYEYEPQPTFEVSDTMYKWEFDEAEDLQTPELPTGCEATACATLLRMYGIPVTKFEMADKMPKSDSDFVNSFMGDPYSPYGWAIMPPGMAWTANRFLEFSGYAAFAKQGIPLKELKLPCEIWVTTYLVAPEFLFYQDGYGMSQANHAMVLISIDGDEAHVVDPLVGETYYDLSLLEKRYEQMGMQAIVLLEWD